MTIRQALPHELPGVGRLVAQAYLEDGLLAEGDAYVSDIRDAPGRARDSIVLVADDTPGSTTSAGGGQGAAGSILGTVTWCPVTSSHREVAHADEGEFRMLGVAVTGRGRGVGEMLVRECVRLADADGLAGLVICTSPRMQAARRIYERLGFVRTPDRDWMPVPDFPLWAYRLDLQRS